MNITTILDLAGLVIVLVAAALFVGAYSLPGAVAVFGAGLLGISWLLDRARKGTKK